MSFCSSRNFLGTILKQRCNLNYLDAAALTVPSSEMETTRGEAWQSSESLRTRNPAPAFQCTNPIHWQGTASPCSNSARVLGCTRTVASAVSGLMRSELLVASSRKSLQPLIV